MKNWKRQKFLDKMLKISQEKTIKQNSLKIPPVKKTTAKCSPVCNFPLKFATEKIKVTQMKMLILFMEKYFMSSWIFIITFGLCSVKIELICIIFFSRLRLQKFIPIFCLLIFIVSEWKFQKFLYKSFCCFV